MIVKGEMSAGCLLTLETVMRMADAGERITLRRISARSGHGYQTTQLHLNRLKQLGLVSCEPNARGTIRPASRFIPEGQL